MKKIRMARVLAVVLMLTMVVTAFVGCGGKSNKTPEELIVGKWESVIDFQKVMESAMESEDDASMLEGIDFSGITMKMGAEFKADGTYAVNVDKESGETAMKQMVEKLVPALKEMIKQEIIASGTDASEVTDEMLDGMLAMFNVDSWDALGDMFIEEMDTDEIFGEINSAGKYLIKDGKLYLSQTADGDPAQEEGAEFTVTDKNLTFKAPGEDTPEYLRELTFNRVG